MTHPVISYLAEAEAAALEVERAKLGTELYRSQVEAARAALDAARGREAALKATLDEVYGRSDSVGAVRRQVKETIEERVAALVANQMVVLSPLTAEEVTANAPVAETPVRVKGTRGPRAKHTETVEAATPSVTEAQGETQGEAQAEPTATALEAVQEVVVAIEAETSPDVVTAPETAVTEAPTTEAPTTEARVAETHAIEAPVTEPAAAEVAPAVQTTAADAPAAPAAVTAPRPSFLGGRRMAVPGLAQ